MIESTIEFTRLNPKEVLARIGSSQRGLSEKEALARLHETGTTHLDAAARLSWLRETINPMVVTLLIVAVFATYLDNIKLAVLLLVAAGINLAAYMYLEKVQAAYFRTLSGLIGGRATVRRGGRPMQIDTSAIAMGDIVCLRGGETVPADLRLIENEKLVLNNGALTGKSEHRRARLAALTAAGNPEQCANLALAGALVVAGEGCGVAIATGRNTRLFELAASRPLPQLRRRAKRLTRSLVRLAAGAVIVVGLASLCFHQPLDQFLIFSTTLVLALMPLSFMSEIALISPVSALKKLVDSACLTPMLQCVLTNISTVALLTILGIALRIWLHIPLALTALHILILYLVFQLVTQIAFGTELAESKAKSRALNIKSSLFFGLLAAGISYGNYWLFFARHGLSPAYVDTASPLYGHAIMLTQITVILCQFANLLLVRAEAHEKSVMSFFSANKPLLVSFGFVFFCVANMAYNPPVQHFFHATDLNLVDWLYAALAVALYVMARWLLGHNRRHSRRAIIELHAQVHGKHSPARI